MDYSSIRIIKRNLCTGEQLTWFRPNHYPTELTFVAHPQATKEDEGILITIVYDGEAEKSYLMLMDAATFRPISKANLPHPVPWSAHGNFYHAREIKRK